MKRNDQRYRKFSASPEDDIADETCTTRLFKYDLAEVKAMCIDGKTKSDVIRELVRRALYARRYRQASTDPAFKEILRTFDEMMGVRLHHLEQRLGSRAEADYLSLQPILGYIYFAVWLSIEELKQVKFMLTDEEVNEEEFLKSWDEKFKLIRGHAERNMRANAEKRRQRLAQAATAEGPGDGGEA